MGSRGEFNEGGKGSAQQCAYMCLQSVRLEFSQHCRDISGNSFTDLHINFPFFILEHFLVYGSYEGELWLRGRVRFIPLCATDQNPFRSKLVISLISHLEILLWICVHF